MTHSAHFLIVYNELSKTRCISSQQANSLIPYTSADAKIHPDRGLGDGGPCHGTIGTIVNQPLYVDLGLKQNIRLQRNEALIFTFLAFRIHWNLARGPVLDGPLIRGSA